MKKSLFLISGTLFSFQLLAQDLQTVTTNGSTTNVQITVSSALGGAMYTGRQIGTAYGSPNAYGAIFTAKSDATIPANVYLFGGYHSANATLGSGTNSFFVRGDGQGYFAGSLGVGTATPSFKLDVNGNSRFNGNMVVANAQVLDVTSGATASGGVATLSLRTNGNNGNAGYAEIQGVYSNVNFNAPLVLQRQGTGNVGIGTTSPLYKLDVSGKAYASSGFATGSLSAEGLHMAHGNSYIAGWNNANNVRTGYLQFNAGSDVTLHADNGNYLAFNTGNQERLRVGLNGFVGIGTANPQTELAVNGTVSTKKVVVTITGWPDYVFDSSYQLQPLKEVATFIKANKHLPGVPAAPVVEKDGLDLGNNQAVLLKKIEELTLYIIQQSTQMEKMQQEIEKLKSSMNTAK